MKKILLGTTAIAAAALYAQAAQAQITVSLGGYTEFFGAYYDDDVAGRTSREFQIETEIVVRADGKADNGLLYGAKVELQNSSAGGGVSTDEASVYLSGTWGRIELGDFDGAADTLAIYAPLVGVEQIDGDAYDFLDVTTPLRTGAVAGEAGTRFGAQPFFGLVKAPDSGDATKIMYLTPRFAGVQAGVSYATQNQNEGQSVVALKTQTVGYKDFWEFGANYTGSFAGFSVAVGATGSMASGEDRQGAPFAGGLGQPPATQLEDFFAWQAGAQVGYAGFKVGGGYIDADDYGARRNTVAGDATAWHVGASYTAGPFAVGVTYADAEGAKGGFTTYASDYKTYGGGVAYTLAPGLVLQGDLMYVDEEVINVTRPGALTESNEGYVAVISTRLNF
jgi:hypothetical protein